MSDFKVERQAAVDAVQEARRLEIDAKLVNIGLGDQITEITVIGPDYILLTAGDDDGMTMSLTELRILSELFNTNAIETFVGDDFKLKISIRAGEL